MCVCVLCSPGYSHMAGYLYYKVDVSVLNHCQYEVFPVDQIQQSHDYLIMLISLLTPTLDIPALPSASGKCIILRYTQVIRYISNASVWIWAAWCSRNLSKSANRRGHRLFFKLPRICSMSRAHKWFILSFLRATVHFVNAPTDLVELSDQEEIIQ